MRAGRRDELPHADGPRAAVGVGVHAALDHGEVEQVLGRPAARARSRIMPSYRPARSGTVGNGRAVAGREVVDPALDLAVHLQGDLVARRVPGRRESPRGSSPNRRRTRAGSALSSARRLAAPRRRPPPRLGIHVPRGNSRRDRSASGRSRPGRPSAAGRRPRRLRRQAPDRRSRRQRDRHPRHEHRRPAPAHKRHRLRSLLQLGLLDTTCDLRSEAVRDERPCLGLRADNSALPA